MGAGNSDFNASFPSWLATALQKSGFGPSNPPRTAEQRQQGGLWRQEGASNFETLQSPDAFVPGAIMTQPSSSCDVAIPTWWHVDIAGYEIAELADISGLPLFNANRTTSKTGNAVVAGRFVTRAKARVSWGTGQHRYIADIDVGSGVRLDVYSPAVEVHLLKPAQFTGLRPDGTPDYQSINEWSDWDSQSGPPVDQTTGLLRRYGPGLVVSQYVAVSSYATHSPTGKLCEPTYTIRRVRVADAGGPDSVIVVPLPPRAKVLSIDTNEDQNANIWRWAAYLTPGNQLPATAFDFGPIPWDIVTAGVGSRMTRVQIPQNVQAIYLPADDPVIGSNRGWNIIFGIDL